MRNLFVTVAILCLNNGAFGQSSFSFVVTADMQWHAGPNRDNPEKYRGVCEAIAREGKGAFMIVPGDLTTCGEVDWTIDKYLGSDYVWYPAVGNHDIEQEGRMQECRDLNPGGKSLPNIVNVGPSGTEETTYSFDYANSHFVVLNIYYNGASDVGDVSVPVADRPDIGDAIYTWLEADLNATCKKHIFVVGHEPTEELDFNSLHLKRFITLLKRKGVVAYLCGHYHHFSHRYWGDGLWELMAPHSMGWAGTVKHEQEKDPGFVKINIEGDKVTWKTFLMDVSKGKAMPYSLAAEGVFRFDDKVSP